MTNNHPITPPLELVQEWAASSPIQHSEESWAYELFIAHQAARWSADTELEACVEWLWKHQYDIASVSIRAARRPKLPSLAEQALAVVENSAICDHLSSEHETILRHALEQLKELEQNN